MSNCRDLVAQIDGVWGNLQTPESEVRETPGRPSTSYAPRAGIREFRVQRSLRVEAYPKFFASFYHKKRSFGSSKKEQKAVENMSSRLRIFISWLRALYFLRTQQEIQGLQIVDKNRRRAAI